MSVRRMNNNTQIVKILICVLGLLLVASVFKNISYPLLWADESMTAMCCERVAEYGYPKVHDGKNTVNDMFCGTPKVAVNKKDDAFIGGANWGQYYYGLIGYKLADGYHDFYTKTGIFRSTFAIIGLLGLFMFMIVMSKMIENSFHKYLFISLFLLAELISVSLILHLREVRYYSPALFLNSSILCIYLWNKFRKPFNKVVYVIILSILLWLLFNMFSPLYFIVVLTIGLSECYRVYMKYRARQNVKDALMPSMPAAIGIVISLAGVFPLVLYFRTFQMKMVLDEFYHFNSGLYGMHLAHELRYFWRLDLLLPALAMRIWTGFNYKAVVQSKSKIWRISNFLSLLFAISFFASPNIDSPMFTRYIIYMQPVLAVIAIFDFIYLLNLYSAGKINFRNPYFVRLAVVFAALFGFTLAENAPYIKGHVFEMTHQYKGPLDYAIPYIKSAYPKPENLIIATNYEETSFMYYLKSKVIVGFVGNNLPEDTLFKPDIISYRQSLGSFFDKVFNGYLSKAEYRKISFPGKDIPLNNIPELNFDGTAFNHYFASQVTDENGKEVNLLIKQ